MSNIAGKQPSNTTHTIYLSDDAPLDAKMVTESLTDFNNLTDSCKWNGMLVYVKAVGKWHEYDKGANVLRPFSGGGSGGTSSLIVPNGKMIVWKYPNNLDNDNIEQNDIIEGFIEGKLIKGKYKGTGATNLYASYEILEEATINV